MWDLCWTKWHWGRFSPSTSVSPANTYSTECCTFIIIQHSGLVQQAEQWPTCQVDSVSPHPNKLKKEKRKQKAIYSGYLSSGNHATWMVTSVARYEGL
jgi:hypothetical protein